MSLLTDLAKNILFHVSELRNTEPSERYKIIFEKFEDFTKTFPLVVKYMCFYNGFDVELFEELVELRDKTRPTYEQGFELQANYVKKLLVKQFGVPRGEAKKQSNAELELIMKNVNSIKKKEREIKKRNETIARENAHELRKELLDFVNEF